MNKDADIDIRNFFYLTTDKCKEIVTLTTKLDCPYCGGESSEEDGNWCLHCDSTGLVNPSEKEEAR